MACRTGAAFLSDADFATEPARWALAYVITWLRVSGADSVLPPWVRLAHPQTSLLLQRLREVPCDHPDCAYCREVHHPEAQLKRYFGFDSFRATPPDRNGGSLQRAIVAAGMRNESVLAILPTGGGKSLCFQLPALVRNHRRGRLTVVISPLQALMKDQVDGLVRRTGMHNAAALNGLLTPPERGQVLRGIRSGSIAILYVSPEQLRSTAFANAVRAREIGCWVLDEAHCLSKWGHDFRPDYLYTGRFIRETAKKQGGEVPPIACFTATAKREVMEEITEYFRRETGSELVRYEGGVERDNLRFEVQLVNAPVKMVRINDLLGAHLPPGGPGCAVVFRATRRNAEETSAWLKDKGWSCECFHAGLTASVKKDIQNRFLAGEVRVICATNAFGMGIDKDDVRLVIHGDTPGSLENYLQEAGRAGRDRLPADCVLLYDEEDCEQQFRMGALSELSRRDIAQILRGLRKAAGARGADEVVITTGEILRDEEVETEFDAAEAHADTKVRAAVSWLERAGFIERNENKTRVVQARPLVRNEEEAKARMAGLNLSGRESGLWLAILREMMNARETDMISLDEIALLPEFQSYLEHARTAAPGDTQRRAPTHEFLSAKILKTLEAMSGAGLLRKDTLLTAYVRHKVANHSSVRLERVVRADHEMIRLLEEQVPDPEGWLPLNLRLVNAELLARGAESSPAMLRMLLRSLAEDGRGFAGQSGSIELRYAGQEAYLVRVRRKWRDIAELAARRRQVAARLLEAILAAIPADTPPRGDLLVEFSFETLQAALAGDLMLRSDLRDTQAAIERGLMFLHEQEVVILQRGLAIFRSAMTIRILPEARGQRYTSEQYDALRHHYEERVFQVHVMNEYARHGLQKIQAALELVLAYFTLDKEGFIQRFLGATRDLLEHATTARSYRAIVDGLGNKNQIRIVTQPVRNNQLILAGPGSGKTRTVVHRCAYLLRVKRVRARSILVCCFNHKAALELRRRLFDLAGKDALGVTIQTYHGLAMRILGKSFRQTEGGEVQSADFDGLIRDAVSVLRGGREVPGIEPDEVRDRLLAGFEHILVDEYQDIDEPQYDMIGAIAGRSIEDADRKLSILAVGDDDQSIYGFRGANVDFIRRFQKDYDADVSHLVENYRSTRHIIEAANTVIARNRDRMKTELPIRIDEGRGLLPPGGVFGDGDERTRGRVAVVEVPDERGQAAAIVREIQRLRERGVESWSGIAVLSRRRRDLAFVRAEAEAAGIPASWPADRDKTPSLHRIRELHRIVQALQGERSANAKASVLMERFFPGDNEAGPATPWTALARSLLEAWRTETGDNETPVSECVEFLYEALAQRRREERLGEGVVLSTIHAAKGMEYDHVLLCGDWSNLSPGGREEERRVLYVGMTRARETLALYACMNRGNPFLPELSGASFAPRREDPVPRAEPGGARDYRVIGVGDLYMDYAGGFDEDDSIHAALRGLSVGSALTLDVQGDFIWLLTPARQRVARLSADATWEWARLLPSVLEVRVLCMVVRRKSDCKEAKYQDRLKVEEWELPFCEVTAPAPTLLLRRLSRARRSQAMAKSGMNDHPAVPLCFAASCEKFLNRRHQGFSSSPPS
ncbi:MAG: RecQ family ATP-dependent DNA helicase [Kiritimatiellia bacterium]